jgi:hypothetical protein
MSPGPFLILFSSGLRTIPSMFAVKLILVLCRCIAALVCCGCLLFTAGILLQGVAQLEGEGLAKQPETAEEAYSRLRIVFVLLLTGLCASLVFQAVGVFSDRLKGAGRFTVRKAAFGALVFWGGVSMFLCLFILAASVQVRWQVAGVYYWLAGGAGAMALVLFGTVGFFADRPTA